MQLLIKFSFLFQKLLCLLQLNAILLQAQNIEDDEFNLFLFTLLIIGLIFIFVSVVIAVIIAAICLLIVFGLIGFGALSASVLIGINKKSFTTGFRVFVISFSTFSLGVVGALSFWILNRIFEWWSTSTAIITGLGFGLISGFCGGIVIAYLIKRLSTFLKNKLDEKRLITDK